MHTYKIKIETTNDTIEHEIEAFAASVNYNSGVIEAATGEGKFTVIRIPDDWTQIDADQELDPELAKQEEQLDAMMQSSAGVPPPPPPVVTAPPGQ